MRVFHLREVLAVDSTWESQTAWAVPGVGVPKLLLIHSWTTAIYFRSVSCSSQHAGESY